MEDATTTGVLVAIIFALVEAVKAGGRRVFPKANGANISGDIDHVKAVVVASQLEIKKLREDVAVCLNVCQEMLTMHKVFDPITGQPRWYTPVDLVENLKALLKILEKVVEENRKANAKAEIANIRQTVVLEKIADNSEDSVKFLQAIDKATGN